MDVLNSFEYSDYKGVRNTGAAYIYVLNSNVWTLSASFVSPSVYLTDSYGSLRGNSSYYLSTFGASVAVFGNYAIIGAPQFSKFFACFIELWLLMLFRTPQPTTIRLTPNMRSIADRLSSCSICPRRRLGRLFSNCFQTASRITPAAILNTDTRSGLA